MKPVRIFIIRNLTTALFIVAYYQQKNMRKDNCRDVCILNWDQELRSAATQDKTPYENMVNAYEKLARMISSEIIFCPEPHLDYIKMNIINLVRDRSEKMKYLETVKNVFLKNNISMTDITEVYHSSRVFHQYVRHLNPKIRLVSFEHGLGDIRNSLLGNAGIRGIKNLIKSIFGKLFFIFNAYADNDDCKVSVFASRIRTANHAAAVEAVEPVSIINTANQCIQSDIFSENLRGNVSKIGVILFTNVGRYTADRERHLKFYRDCAWFISSKIKELTPEIDTLLLKPKEFSSYFADAKSGLLECFKGYRVFIFSEISMANFPIEFYLDAIRPIAIFGNTSYGLLTAKEIMPELKTFTYHPFLVNYLYRNFGRIFPDYQWIFEIFYRRYRKAFEGILPAEIPFQH